MSDAITTGKNALVANAKAAAPVFIVGVVASAVIAAVMAMRK